MCTSSIAPPEYSKWMLAYFSTWILVFLWQIQIFSIDFIWLIDFDFMASEVMTLWHFIIQFIFIIIIISM